MVPRFPYKVYVLVIFQSFWWEMWQNKISNHLCKFITDLGNLKISIIFYKILSGKCEHSKICKLFDILLQICIFNHIFEENFWIILRRRGQTSLWGSIGLIPPPLRARGNETHLRANKRKIMFSKGPRTIYVLPPPTLPEGNLLPLSPHAQTCFLGPHLDTPRTILWTSHLLRR